MRGLRALAVSAGITAAMCPPLTRALLRQGRMDEPNHRSSHTVPTPRGGGIACLAGVVTTAAASALAGHSVAVPALTGAVALAGVGYADDRAGLSAAPRLAAQAGVGGAVGAACTGTVAGAAAGAAITSSVVNATNFMDGVNGISGLTAAVWGLNALVAGADVESPALVGLGGMTAGAGLGFLPSNIPTARLFLGDVGSYLLGGLFAGGVVTAPATARLRVGAPLSVYLADTGATLVRRGLRGEPLTEAHREHTYQRLVADRGFTHTQSSLVAAATAGAVALVEWTSLPVAARRTLQAGLLTGYVMLPELLALASASARGEHEVEELAA